MVTTISSRDSLIINNFINLFCHVGVMFLGKDEVIRVSQKLAHEKAHLIKDYQGKNLALYKQSDLQY